MAAADSSQLERLRAGERAALTQLIEAHHGFLLSMVGPLVGRDVAEDVVQEAWIKAFAAVSRFEGRSALRTWLAQIALNTARSWRRSHRQELRAEHGGEDPGSPIEERRSEYEREAWRCLIPLGEAFDVRAAQQRGHRHEGGSRARCAESERGLG